MSEEANPDHNAHLVELVGGVLRDEAHVFSSGPKLLRQLLESGAWRDFVTRRGDHVQPHSFEEFVTTPLLKGLGADMDVIRRVASADPVTLDLLDQAQQRPHGGDRTQGKIDNVQLAPTGNSSPRALRKLRDDAPELHAEVLAGRLSAHRAMVQAGYRPRTLSVRPDDPASVVKTLRTHMEPEALVELMRLLADALQEQLCAERQT